MKNSIKSFTVILLLFSTTQLSAQLDAFWTQEIYRVGSVLQYERSVNGELLNAGSNAGVSNIVYNHFIETKGVYSRVDLSLMMYLLPFNNDQNQHWSLNFTIGAFLNDNPIELGSLEMNYGVGIDFDLSTTKIFLEDGTDFDLESGTIGANARIDLSITDWLILKNSFTYGWWGAHNARKFDFRSVISAELLDGLYLTATPNYLSHASKREKNGLETEVSAQHFYFTFGIGIDW